MKVGKNIKKFISVLLIVSFLFMCVPFSHLKNVEANNIVLDGYLRQPDHGRNYWQTSNLREWLNSAEETVNYTCNSPSRERLGNNAYDSEPGFLSEFTPEEQNAITVTEHRVFIAGCDASVKDGGSSTVPMVLNSSKSIAFSVPKLLDNWQEYCYQNVKDKVYIMNIYELYTFVQKRGNTTERSVTNAAKQKYNYYNKNINYWMATAGNTSSGDGIYIPLINMYTTYGNGICVPRGVVPVINLKPNYVLSNGKQAKDLSIDEIVIFGRHLGEPIEWRVVNIQDGYPMLLAEKAVSIKAYDAPGDPALKYSEYIDFSDEPYIDRTNPIYIAKDKHSDVNSPRFIFQNKDELWERQNEEFTFSLRVEDNSIIEGVILPNGEQLSPNNTGTEFEYTVTENGNFLFIAWDIHKNYKHYVIPVGNVNIPATVVIEPSADGWTNKDVDVDINVTNDVGYEVAEKYQSVRAASGPVWINYTSYAEKRIRISGNIELVSANKPVDNVAAKIGVGYHFIGNNQDDFYIIQTWISLKNFLLKDLQNNGVHHFDFEYTVPGNYHSAFHPWFNMTITNFESGIYTIKWTNIKYELLDNDDLKIEKITLPTGEEIFGQSSYTDTLTEEGEYLYTVLDSRGLIYNRTVRVWIDKIRPTINITADKNHLTKEVVLTATAEDDRSGIDRIVLPNNSTVAGNGNNRIEVPYNVIANGSYTFKVYDRAGNYAEKKVTVNNILDSIVAYFDSNPAVSFPVSIRTGGTSQLTITAFYAGCPCGDITKEADCISSNPDIVEIITGEDGKKTVHGKSKGDAVITINYEGITASIPIEVRPKLYLYIRTLQ